MRNYKSYRPKIISLFQSFLAEKINEEELLTTLTAIERNLKNGVTYTQKTLWFRFYTNDTGATDILNIRRWLYDFNRESLKEDFRLAIENPKELSIYYS